MVSAPAGGKAMSKYIFKTTVKTKNHNIPILGRRREIIGDVERGHSMLINSSAVH